MTTSATPSSSQTAASAGATPSGALPSVAADPYPWPFDGDFRPANTALVVIDMQTDFCGVGGYVDKMGYDLSLTRAPIKPIKRVLAAMRAAGYHIIHTREGHRPDLTDCPSAKLTRGGTTFIGTEGTMGRILVRGEKGHDIIPELYPIDGEPIIDKPGKGAFYATDLERCPVDGAFTGADVERAIAGHVLAEARLTGTYSLNPSVR